MDYSKMTMPELVKARKDIQLQMDALNELDKRLIEEISIRAGERIQRDLNKLFGF